MNWRRHQTDKEKQIRRKMYKKLRKAGLSPHVAMVCRDWTTSKVNRICKDHLKPILTW